MDILIGYDDHMSMYGVDDSELNALLTIEDADELNDYIIENGIGYEVADADGGDVFLDMMGHDVDEFHVQLREYTE